MGAVVDSAKLVVDVVVTVSPATVCNTVDGPTASVFLVDSGSLLTVAAVVEPSAVAGNADVTPADAAVVALVVRTNDVGASADDSLVMDVLAVVDFTSPVLGKDDDPSVFGAAVVGANVDFVVPDAVNVVIPADEEPVSACVVGSCVTLSTVVETSDVWATVTGFTDINVVDPFWTVKGSVVT